MKRNVIAALIGLTLLALAFQAGAVTYPQPTSTETSSIVASITPNNGITFTQSCRAIYVGTAGSVTLDATSGGTNIAFAGATAGSVLPVRTKRVYSTGTTATGLVCLY